MSPTKDSDDRLMLHAAAGDREAFEHLYKRHSGLVFRIAWHHLGDAEEARDVLQDVFVRLIRSASRYRPQGKFKSWLRTMTVNVCLNERSRAWRRLRHIPREECLDSEEPEWSANHAHDGPDSFQTLTTERTRERVRRAIHALPERQRMAVILSCFEDLDHATVSESLGCTVGATTSLLARARRALAMTLADLGP